LKNLIWLYSIEVLLKKYNKRWKL